MMTKKEDGVKFEIKDKYTLDEIKVGAMEFLEDAKDSNETTFKNYRTSVNYFLYLMNCNKHRFATIDNNNKDKALKKFKNCLLNGFTYEVESVDDVLGYTKELETEKDFKPVKRNVNINASGVNTHLRRITTFFNQYLHLRIKNFENCQVDKPKYKSLTIDHVKLLIDECSNCWKKEEIATRNATLIRLLFNGALRIREALEITINDTNFIDYDDETNKATLKTDVEKYCVKIQQKGRNKKDKTIAIPKDMAKHIVDYINIKKVPSNYLFSTTRTSQDGKAKPLTRRYFNNEIIKLASFVDDRYDTKTNDYNNISEVVKNNSSHVFRHSRGAYLLKDKQTDIRTVQRVLRHASLTSTEIYTEPSQKAVDNINTNDYI